MDKIFGHFQSYFPGGSRRLVSEGGYRTKEDELEIVADICNDVDKLMAESRFTPEEAKDHQLYFFIKMKRLGYSKKSLTD